MASRIVVPVDDSPTCERAVRVAAALAPVTGATVELVTVDPLGADPGWTEHRLHQLAAIAGDEVDVVTTVLPTLGTVVEALASLDRGEGTVVCLAPHDRGPLASAVLGSVTEGLVRRSTHPLLLVGPRCEVPVATSTRPVLAAVDGSPRDDAVLDASFAWARDHRTRVEVVHVVTRPSELAAWTRADAVLGHAEHRARDADVQTTTSLVAAADVETGLVRATSAGAGCAMLGSHRRRGLGRLVLGSTVAALVRRSRCPVLVTGQPTPGPDSTDALVGATTGQEADDAHDR